MYYILFSVLLKVIKISHMWLVLSTEQLALFSDENTKISILEYCRLQFLDTNL